MKMSYRSACGSAAWVLTFLAAVFLCSLAYAETPHKIVVIKSEGSEAYGRAIEGVIDVLDENGLREGTDWAIDEYNVDEARKMLQGFALEERPKILLLAFGKEAALAFRDSGWPLIFSTILNPADSGLAGMGGVAIDVPPEVQLRTLKAIIPNARQIGIIYNPSENQKNVDEIKRIAEGLDLSIVPEAITNYKEMPEVARTLIPKIDALLLIPDSIATEKGSLEYLFVQSFWNKKPVVGFAPYLAQAGALVAFVTDYYDIGRQTGRLVMSILAGKDAASVPVIFPRKIKLVINMKIAKKLDIYIPPYISKQASQVIE